NKAVPAPASNMESRPIRANMGLSPGRVLYMHPIIARTARRRWRDRKGEGSADFELRQRAAAVELRHYPCGFSAAARPEFAVGAPVLGRHLAAAARRRGAAPAAAGQAEIGGGEVVFGDLGANVVDNGGKLLLAGFFRLLLELF